MGSRPNAGAWVRFVLYGTLDVKEWSNVFWYSVTSGVPHPPGDGSHAAAAFNTTVVAPFLAVVSSQTNVRGVYTEISDGTVVIGTDYYNPQTGGAGSSTLPEDTAVVVQKITAVGGKPGRGRWYFTGIDAADTDASYLSSSGQTAWNTFATALKTIITYSGTGSVTLSAAHFSPSVGNLEPIVNTPVVALLGTQRKRRGPF